MLGGRGDGSPEHLGGRLTREGTDKDQERRRTGCRTIGPDIASGRLGDRVITGGWVGPTGLVAALGHAQRAPSRLGKGHAPAGDEFGSTRPLCRKNQAISADWLECSKERTKS